MKFRARNAGIPRGWIYGYFAIIEEQCFIFNKDGKFSVIAGTESQYTGQNDKNGKEIYKGHIVKWQAGYYKAKRNQNIVDSVIFEGGCFKTKKYNMPIGAIPGCEIIGNKYENKED